VNLKLDQPNNGIELAANALTMELVADFTFTALITVTGKADIKIKTMGLDFDFGFAT
jgi:hypothetical protein